MSARMRIHRALARAGVASRRRAEDLVRGGRVTVNGLPATIGQVIDVQTDRLLVDGRAVEVDTDAPVWFVLHKPAGVMTTRRDPQRRQTVFTLVPDRPGLHYVGRLDYDTEGVLLLTTDGEMAHRLAHPSSAIERVYEATVRGDAPLAARQAPKGVSLGDGLARPLWARARRIADERWALEIALAEGRKREVRRICRALGLSVERLVRTRFGPIVLGDLPLGAARALTESEIATLSRLATPARSKPGLTPGYHEP